MKHFNFKKSDLKYFIIAFISVLLIISSRFIPNEGLRPIAENIAYFLIVLYFVIELYEDLTKKQFTTTIYIIIADIIGLLAFAAILYLAFVKFDRNNIDTILELNKESTVVKVLLFLIILAKSYLRQEKFSKVDESDL